MTAKRFTLWRTLDLDGHTDEWDIIDNTRLDVDEGHICEEEVVELLNALHEENKTLLHIIDWCLTHHREVGHIVFDSRDEFFIWLKEKGVLE